MKLNKKIKKFLAVTLSLAMVLTSMVISDVTAKAEGEFEITDIRWDLIDGVKVFDVDFTSAYGNKDTDPYLYCIYLDQMDSDHSAINYSLEWNWKDNLREDWLNTNGGMHNNFKFDKVFTTAADFAVNNKESKYLSEGTHTVYIAAYSTLDDAKSDQNAVGTASKEFEVPAEVETTTEAPITTAADADTVVPVEITSAVKDANNGITVSWTQPAGMEEYTQEYYLGTTDEVVEDENHWAKNGTANWVWGQAKGRTAIDNVVATKDDSLNVNNGGNYVIRVVYKDAEGKVVARGTTDPISFDKYSNTDMNLFQERNVELTVFLKWTKVTGAATYALYDAEGTEVKNNINTDWVDVVLPAYDTDYTYTVKAFDSEGNEIEVTNNTTVARVASEDATTTPVATEPETTTPVVTDPETTTPVVTDPETTTPVVTDPETTTPVVTDPETTTPVVTEAPTTTKAPTTTTKKPAKKVLKKTKITKATRKSVKAKKIKLTFKRVKNANKYKVEVSTSKKFKKVLVRKTVKKVSVTIAGKALKNKKKLFVRVRAVGATKWAVKQVKIKK